MKTSHYKLFLTLFLFGCGIAAYPQNNDMTVTDCQGNIYPVVKIGKQYWMAENLRCSQYDSESELSGATLQTSYKNAYLPYYADATNKTYWDTEFAGELTDEQIKKLGYLYNFSATVGLTDIYEITHGKGFKNKRQGICPNGWHVPSIDELKELLKFLKKEHKNTNGITAPLRATSGWYTDLESTNNSNGTDEYNFSALPSGFTLANMEFDKGTGIIHNVGLNGSLQASNSTKDEHDTHYSGGFNLDPDGEFIIITTHKKCAHSVRCVKN